MKLVNLANPVNRHAPLNRGLVSWWLTLPGLDGGRYFYDLINQNHGVLTNGAIWNTSNTKPGGYGGSIVFDETNDYINMTSLAEVFGGKTAVTMAMWFKMLTSSGQTLVDVGTLDFRIFVYGDPFFRIGVDTRFGQAGILETSDNAFTMGEWTRILVTIAPSDQRLYVNGKLITSNTSSAFTQFDPDADHYFNIGSSNGGLTSCNACYDDIKLYFRTFSAEEARADYLASIAGNPNELNRIPIETHSLRYLRNYYYPLQDSLSKYLVLSQYQ